MIRLAITAALLAAGTASAAKPAPSYDIKLTLRDDHAVLAAPRLIAQAGKTATMASDDGKGNGFRAELIAVPDASRPGQIAVAWSLTLTHALPDGKRDRRTMRTELSLRDPGHAQLDVPASADAGVVHVDLALATLPPRS